MTTKRASSPWHKFAHGVIATHRFRHLIVIAQVVAIVVLFQSGACAQDAQAQGGHRAVLRGVVVDAKGAPLAGATVKIDRCSDARVTNFRDLQAVTDERGHYRILIRWTDGEQLTLMGVQVVHAGYVMEAWQEGHRLSRDDEFTLDFTLQRGEQLAGTIERPVTSMEQRAGLTSRSNRYRFTVTSDNFTRSFITGPGGHFDECVPPGTYTIRVLDPPLIVSGVEVPVRDLRLQPEPLDLTPERLTDAFDALGENMDRHYSYFALKKIDWQTLRAQYRPRAAECETLDDFITLLKEMLAQLDDMHVWIDTPSGLVGTCECPWQRNWSPTAVQAALSERIDCGRFAIVGQTRDGFGVLIIAHQPTATPANVRQTLDALATLRDAPGFIVDLRGGCAGGNEALV